MWRRRLFALLKAWGLVRRHYMSFFSLGALGTALALTLGAISPPFSGSTVQDRPALDSVSQTGQRSHSSTALVTYFLYDDPRQRDEVDAAMQAEGAYLDVAGISSGLDSVYFLEVGRLNEEAITILVYEVAPIAPAGGYDVVITDLRRR